MRKFVKGKLETVVEDNDRRIPDYLAKGWEEVTPKAPTTNGGQSATDKALEDVANSENGNATPKGKGGKGKTGKPSKTDKKVNDAIDANSNAAAEGDAIDDGLEPNNSTETETETATETDADEPKGGE